MSKRSIATKAQIIASGLNLIVLTQDILITYDDYRSQPPGNLGFFIVWCFIPYLQV